MTFAVMVLSQLIAHFLSLSACLWVLLQHSLYCHIADVASSWCPGPAVTLQLLCIFISFNPSAQRGILDLSTCSNCYVYLPVINIVPVLVWLKYFHKGAISSAPVTHFPELMVPCASKHHGKSTSAQCFNSRNSFYFGHLLIDVEIWGTVIYPVISSWVTW